MKTMTRWLYRRPRRGARRMRRRPARQPGPDPARQRDDRGRRARPVHRQRSGDHRRPADGGQRLRPSQGRQLFARHPPDRQRRDAADDEHDAGRRQAPDRRRLQQRRHDGRDDPRRRGSRPRPEQGEVSRLQHVDRLDRPGRCLPDHRGLQHARRLGRGADREPASPACRPPIPSSPRRRRTSTFASRAPATRPTCDSRSRRSC